MTMDFNSLTQGASFYIIGTANGLEVAVATVKGKSAPYWPMPNNGINQQVIDVTINLGGQDRVVPGLPIGLEVAGRDPEIYTGNRELAERIIDERVDAARKALQDRPRLEKIVADGPNVKEIINPGYAQTRRQAETIEQLQKRLAETEGKMSEMANMQARTLELLEKMSGGTAPSGKKKDS